ncbi:hypothetical protein Ancab_033027 [Ancistrocladus abbreviatus]
MGRYPCCDDRNGLKKGPWTPEEDEKLISYVQKHGHGSWGALPKLAGLNRCGKSCRLRWTNYLRPDIKRGMFSDEEEQLIIKLHSVLGNRWSRIAIHLPGRTDNEIKNYWNTHIRRKLLQRGIDPITHKPRTDLNFLSNLSQLLTTQNLTTTPLINNPWENATQLAKLQVLQNIFQILNTSTLPIVGQIASSPVQNINQIGKSINSPNTTSPINTVTNAINSIEAPNYAGLTQARLEAENYCISDSWTSNESGQGNNVCECNYQSRMNSLYDAAKQDYELPALASISPETSTMNQIGSSNNSSYGSPSDDFLETWEKLLDDGNTDSFWKDFLN